MHDDGSGLCVPPARTYFFSGELLYKLLFPALCTATCRKRVHSSAALSRLMMMMISRRLGTVLEVCVSSHVPYVFDVVG